MSIYVHVRHKCDTFRAIVFVKDGNLCCGGGLPEGYRSAGEEGQEEGSGASNRHRGNADVDQLGRVGWHSKDPRVHVRLVQSMKSHAIEEVESVAKSAR